MACRYRKLDTWLASRSQLWVILSRRSNVSATLVFEILVGSLTCTLRSCYLLGRGSIVMTERLIEYRSFYFV